jgi:hypothetical protein
MSVAVGMPGSLLIGLDAGADVLAHGSAVGSVSPADGVALTDDVEQLASLDGLSDGVSVAVLLVPVGDGDVDAEVDGVGVGEAVGGVVTPSGVPGSTGGRAGGFGGATG